MLRARLGPECRDLLGIHLDAIGAGVGAQLLRVALLAVFLVVIGAVGLLVLLRAGLLASTLGVLVV